MSRTSRRLGGVALVAAAACAPSPAPVSLGPLPTELPAAAPTADAGPPPTAGRCPQDAPWTGRVCLGHGYVACPGGARMGDAGSCNPTPREGRDGGPPGSAAPPPAVP